MPRKVLVPEFDPAPIPAARPESNDEYWQRVCEQRDRDLFRGGQLTDERPPRRDVHVIEEK